MEISDIDVVVSVDISVETASLELSAGEDIDVSEFSFAGKVEDVATAGVVVSHSVA